MNAQKHRELRHYLRMILPLCLLLTVNVLVTRFIGRREMVPVTPIGAEQISQENSLALERYEKLTAKDVATVRNAASPEEGQKAELILSGLTDPDTTRSILTILGEGKQNVSFFVSAADADAYPESLALIFDAGYSIGASLPKGTPSLVGLSPKETIPVLSEAELRIKSATGIWPSALLYRGDALPDGLPMDAAACGFIEVVVPGASIDTEDALTAQQAVEWVRSCKRGTLLCVDLTASAAVGDTLSALTQALQATDLNVQAANLINQNHGKLSQEATRVYTSERAVAFTFSGMRNSGAELQGVLDALQGLSATGMFLISPDAPQNNPELVRHILSAGQDLGVSIGPTQYQSVQDAVRDLLIVQEVLAEEFGYQKILPVCSAFAGASKLLCEATSATGLPLISSLLSPVRASDMRATDVQAVLRTLFGASNPAPLQRGEIVHFQMSQYQNSEQLLGQLVMAIAMQKSPYPVVSLTEMLNNPAVYEYPLPREAMLPALRDAVHPGQLTQDVVSYAQSRYIGNPYYNTPNKMPGFTRAEIRILNQNGRITAEKDNVYLTFDDWGTDAHLTALLDVLAKHQATATFFVRTNNVHYNPNLLRAIAVAGHTIGSHTHMHLPLSNPSEKGDSAESLTEAQVSALKEDLVTSWNTLLGVVGDVSVNGKSSLSLIFRPPTLAVSKVGMEAVFDCGFHYIVSGSLTTQDYKAKSVDELYRMLVRNTKSGAVFVLHMSDNSVYTPEAVDQYLTYLEAEGKYHARGLNDVLP